MPLLDLTIGGGTAFVKLLPLLLTLAPRGRNKKYHTRKRTMAKPCRIMVVIIFFLARKRRQRRQRNRVGEKGNQRRYKIMRPMQSGTIHQISVVTSISGLEESGTGLARFGFGFFSRPPPPLDRLPSSADDDPFFLDRKIHRARTTETTPPKNRAPSSSSSLSSYRRPPPP